MVPLSAARTARVETPMAMRVIRVRYGWGARCCVLEIASCLEALSSLRWSRSLAISPLLAAALSSVAHRSRASNTAISYSSTLAAPCGGAMAGGRWQPIDKMAVERLHSTGPTGAWSPLPIRPSYGPKNKQRQRTRSRRKPFALSLLRLCSGRTPQEDRVPERLAGPVTGPLQRDRRRLRMQLFSTPSDDFDLVASEGQSPQFRPLRP
ncbi:hypothetical protein P154DRAFT_616053 [Amniculicola lignicola CBS 123094]|uniref:Uncharacterized protein n=1 Tax=Amniculicola lignicola CBS 123094 TaxID=1392246 RepID=A0A6A5WUW8_9PLEO|nr:hypothetical protein P154DRAFT_616053 [Amniculicola lignicola CBS 123094]